MEITQLTAVTHLFSNSTSIARGAGVDPENAARGDLPLFSEMATKVVFPECLGSHQEVREAGFFILLHMLSYDTAWYSVVSTFLASINRRGESTSVERAEVFSR